MKTLKNNLLSLLMVSMLFAGFGTLEVRADVIIDNGDSGTSYTGIWRVSGGSEPYGGNSLWARDGVRYTWQFDSAPAGSYEVLMWWSQWPSRSTAINVQINHDAGSSIEPINQFENAGQWNSLGTYYFDSSGSVIITAANGSTVSTCADAVWFRFISGNLPPTAYIDSIVPNPADPGQAVEFTGHGQDSDGSVVAQRWVSDIDDFINDANSFSTALLSEGVHTISFEVQDNDGAWSDPVTETLVIGEVPVEVIIDNLDEDTSRTGSWQVSGASNSYDVDSVWSRDGSTFSWLFTPSQSGQYEMSMWWTQWSSRSTTVPVEIEYSGGMDTVYINQQQDGGQWNSVGASYLFNAGTTYAITVTSQPGPSSTCADAVKFNLLQTNTPPAAYIDSIAPNPAELEDDIAFYGHGTDIDGSVAGYNWQSAGYGQLSDEPNFVMSASLIGRGIHTISFSVADDNGVWSPVITETLTIGNSPPTAAIDSIAPNPAGLEDEIAFYGHGTDIDGSVAGYNWQSAGYGQLSDEPNFVMSASLIGQGTHTISFSVMDDDAVWSPVVTGTLTIVNLPPAAYIDSIAPNPAELEDDIAFYGHGTDIDGAVAGCDWQLVGYWQLSDEPNFVMSASLIGQGIHTISFSVADDNGVWSPVITETLTIGNSPPTAYIDSITPNPANDDELVSFSGHGEDSDGTIAEYSWVSSIDGDLSDENSFSISTLSIGEHTISFRVYDDDGDVSEPVNRSLTIQGTSTEPIIDNRDSRTSSTGSWQVSGASNPYDADSVWSRDGSTFSWIFTPTISGYHDLSMWWTQWPSRSTVVPVDIEHSGATSRVYINQQQNGGRWNSLGSYLFEAPASYDITITAQSAPTSTCADAVRLTYQGTGGNMLPNATIDSIIPNPPKPGQMVTFSGHGSDGDGTIEGYNWRSNTGGQLSQAASFSVSSLPIGTHTIYLRVSDNLGAWSPEVSATVTVGTEHIYICFTYAGLNINRFNFTSMLWDMGATQQSSTRWTYVDSASNMTYIIHLVSDTSGFIQALQTDAAHIIIIGHSNYGLGPIFATTEESNNEMINNIRYIDDPRIVNLGTPWVHVSVSGMRTGQAYPYWWPNYQDGTSGIMPYDFGDPRGDPPYNYYITYQVPGDPNHYKVGNVHNSGIQRFFDSRKPAWYSMDGAEPSASDPNHHQYYITNPAPKSVSCQVTGNWQQYQELPANTDDAEYFKENYIYNAAGSGADQVKWFFTIPEAGNYNVSAWWPASASNATNTPYTVTHASGNTTVRMNQTINGRQWNELGHFYFDADDYSVLLTDAASSGSVAADGIRVSHVDNPPEIIAAEFSTWTRSGPAPLDVTFSNDSIGDLTGRIWNFGDGKTNTTRDYIDHTYTSTGTYTVSLTASGPAGSDTKTKTGYIIVGANLEETLYAEFSAGGWGGGRIGSVPLSVRFRDNSTGDLREGITYTPNPGFTGTDTITYTVVDNDGAVSNEATVTVKVYAGNIAPVANDDSANTRPDTPVTIDVIDNDIDPDGNIESDSVTIINSPNNGLVEVDGIEGTVTYTPNTSFTGTDTFTYTVADDDAIVSNEAVVTVFTGNLPPVARDDSAETDEDTPVTIDILDNDSDADGTIEPNSVTITTGPDNGTVDVDEVDGTVTYTPNTGFTGTDTFIYIVADNEAVVSNEATVTINPANVSPTANDDSAYTEEPDEITIDILDNDDDSDGSIDPGTIVITSGPSNGTVVVHDSWLWGFGDGAQSHEQRPTHTYSEVGNYTVTLTVTDADGEMATETKNNFVRVIVYEKSIDNVDYPKDHSGGKVWVYTKGLEVPKADMKYTRMLYESCNSGNYYIEIFDRGILFYTTRTSDGLGSVSYLRAYLEGQSDEEIWEIIQDVEPSYDYCNCDLPPQDQLPPQTATQTASKLTAASAVIVVEPASLSPQKKKKIRQLGNLSLSEVFAKLKEPDFLVNNDLLQTAISTAMADKKTDAITLALKYVKLPVAETIDGETINRSTDFYVAKKILQLFSDQSIQQLLALYESGDSIAKGNVISVAGKLTGDPAVKNMLLTALDDKTSYENKHPEASEVTLRICDLAYNQLVLNYKIKNVLRTISTMHGMDVRDYHINILKGMGI